MNRKLTCILIAVLLIAMLTVPAFAAEDDAPIAPNPGAAVIKTDPDLGQVLVGIRAQPVAQTIESLMPQIQQATAPDAAVLDPAGNESIDISEPVCTGQLIRWTLPGGMNETAIVILRGDCLGTGVLDVAQIVRAAQALNGSEPLDGPSLKAADLDEQPGISIVDLILLAQQLQDETGITEEEKAAIIQAAVDLQTSGGTYQADTFDVVFLQEGDVIFGMLPGQSAFYTDAATVEECGGSYVEMYQKLQMLPHPEYGYRTQVGTYRVLQDMWVATGLCLANSVIGGVEAGAGGGLQYVIPDYETMLELTDTVDLHE